MVRSQVQDDLSVYLAKLPWRRCRGGNQVTIVINAVIIIITLNIAINFPLCSLEHYSHEVKVNGEQGAA